MTTLHQVRERLWREGWALLLLRLITGFGFAFHGYAKLGRGPEKFAAILTVLHIPAPSLMAWTTTLLELLGGIALMLGAGVSPLAVPLVVTMLVALFGVHFRYGFSSVGLKAITAAGAQFAPVGYELNLLYIGALVALALSAPGPLSVDRWLALRRKRGSVESDG